MVFTKRPCSLEPGSITKPSADGSFSFSNVPIGIYDLSVRAPDLYISNLKNITVTDGSEISLPDLELKQLKKLDTYIEDISSNETYFCIITLFVMAFITLVGAICAFQRKRYGIAFIGAILGIAPVLLVTTTYICGASIVSILGLVLLVFSREEFYFKPVR